MRTSADVDREEATLRAKRYLANLAGVILEALWTRDPRVLTAALELIGRQEANTAELLVEGSSR